MAESIRYVVKRTLALYGQIKYKPGMVVPNQEHYRGKGFTDEQWKDLCNAEAVIVSTDSTIMQAKVLQPHNAPVNIDSAKPDQNEDRAPLIKDPDELRTHANNPNQKLGYDHAHVSNMKDGELRSTLQRQIPGLSSEHVQKMSRSQMEDTLQQHHRDAPKDHKVGEDATQHLAT